LLESLKVSYVRNNFEFYSPIIKELVTKYSNGLNGDKSGGFTRRTNFSTTVKILDHFTKLQIKNPTIYNSVLAEIGNNFNNMNQEDRISCLRSFTRVKIRQPDFLLKNFQKFLETPLNY